MKARPTYEVKVFGGWRTVQAAVIEPGGTLSYELPGSEKRHRALPGAWRTRLELIGQAASMRMGKWR